VWLSKKVLFVECMQSFIGPGMANSQAASGWQWFRLLRSHSSHFVGERRRPPQRFVDGVSGRHTTVVGAALTVVKYFWNRQRRGGPSVCVGCGRTALGYDHHRDDDAKK
jgi:hypothetical protein